MEPEITYLPAEEESEEKIPLEIPEGMILEAIMQDEQVLFVGRVENFNNDTLFLVDPDDHPVPPVSFGTEVKLRGTLPDGRFGVYHGTVISSRDTMWKIGELCDWYGWERRSFFRQSLSIEARVMRTRRAAASRSLALDVKMPCRLLDISGSGVLVACAQDQFTWDDQLTITDAVLFPGEAPFSFMCTVKRIVKARTNNVYGCEFFGLSSKEQDRLVHTVFRLQALARRQRADLD